MVELPAEATDLRSRLDRLQDQLVNRALEMTAMVYEQRVATVLEDEKVAAALTPKDRNRLEKLKHQASRGSRRRRLRKELKRKANWPHVRPRRRREDVAPNPVDTIDVLAWIELKELAEKNRSLSEAIGLATWAGPGSFGTGVAASTAFQIAGAMKAWVDSTGRPRIAAMDDARIQDYRDQYNETYAEFFELVDGEKDRTRIARQESRRQAAQEALAVGKDGIAAARSAWAKRRARSTSSSRSDAAEALAKLADLRDAAAITEAEFAEKKAKLLDQI